MNTNSVKIYRDMEIDGDYFALVVETQHGPATAITAIHRRVFQRSIGGARFVRRGGLSEVGHLASSMTEKCLAACIPADGQKTLIVFPEGIPQSMAVRAAILSEHIRQVAAIDPGVIFGPDMNNPEGVLDLVFKERALQQHVTGLSEESGGLGIDKNGYTALGIWHSIKQAHKLNRLQLRSATIQGFGAVGAHLAQMISGTCLAIHAVSNIFGMLAATDRGPLAIDQLYELWEEVGDDALATFNKQYPASVFRSDPDRLLDVPTDVFVPAARTSILAMSDELVSVRKENPRVQAVSEFLEKTNVKLIAEAANHPLTMDAEQYLESKQVSVLPDYIINCGGLIGCYIELAHRDELLESHDSRERIEGKVKQAIKSVIENNIQLLLMAPGNIRQKAAGLAQSNLTRIKELCGSISTLDDKAMAHLWLQTHVKHLAA